MRKLFYITTIIVIALVSFLGITYSYEYNDDSTISFELIGPYELYLDVNGEYEEYGIKAIKNGYDVSSLVKIDNSLVNVAKIGEYKVKYEIFNDEYTEYVYRLVKVIDKVSPVIKLNGDNIVYVNIGDRYFEEGFVVSDNYDNNLSSKVIISSNLITSIVGEYEIEYRVSDSSGNETKVYRIVRVVDKETKEGDYDTD